MSEFLRKLTRLVVQPLKSASQMSKRLWSRLHPRASRVQVDDLFRRYSQLAEEQGLSKLYFLLSFDCDTPEDIPAARDLGVWLQARGIKVTYAVPGILLQEGAEVYRQLAIEGSEFINHGARQHAEWRDGRYWSVTFYNEMSSEEVTEDILRGHEIACQVFEKKPIGFRAPHFGYIASEDQRAIIYATLRKLGYVYSSSTLPEFGLNHGPLVDVDGLFEIPLSGSYAHPFTILDSWNYILSPDRPVLKPEYATHIIETMDRLLTLEVAGVLNYYVDPAHVCNSKAFYRAMEYLLEKEVETVHFGDLIEAAKGSR